MGLRNFAVAVNLPSFDSVSDTSLDTEVGTSFSYTDNLSLVRGRHDLKFGVDIRRIRLNNSGNTLTTSSITYATNGDFINNTADAATYLRGEGVVGNRRTFYQAYAQDDFRIRSNLTLNLGLRYEYYSVVHEILNRSAVVDILSERHGILRSESQGFRASHRRSLDTARLKWKNYDSYRLRHLLWRQSERRFQRSG